LTALYGALGLLGAGLGGELSAEARALLMIALRNCYDLQHVVEGHLQALAQGSGAPPEREPAHPPLGAGGNGG
jgi:hypothetical protein